MHRRETRILVETGESGYGCIPLFEMLGRLCGYYYYFDCLTSVLVLLYSVGLSFAVMGCWLAFWQLCSVPWIAIVGPLLVNRSLLCHFLWLAGLPYVQTLPIASLCPSCRRKVQLDSLSSQSVEVVH